MPRLQGLEPSVEQRHVKREERLNRFLTLVSSKDPLALPIHQDVEFVVAALEPGASASHNLEPGYGAYFYVASGSVQVNGQMLLGGDAARVTLERKIEVLATRESEGAMVVVRVWSDSLLVPAGPACRA